MVSPALVHLVPINHAVSDISGAVGGPSSSTDNAIVRFDGTTGKLVQNSVVLVGDTGAVTGVTTLSMSGQLTNTVSTGTAPFVVSSTTVVTNLNADLLDGFNGSSYFRLAASNTVSGENTFTQTQNIVTSSNEALWLNLTNTNEDINGPYFINFLGEADTYSAGSWKPIQYWDTFTTFYPEALVRAAYNSTTVASSSGLEIFIPIMTEDCFLSETLVNTPTGMKAIIDINEGDEVFSKNIQTGEIEINVVDQKLCHDRGGKFVIINEQIRATNHKMYVNDDWVKVADMKIGDYLRNINGEKVWVYSLEYVDHHDPFKTYNLKMKYQGCANYFVHDILVHNKCPFLYSFNKELTQPWVYENTFLYELDSKEKATTQRRKLKTLTNKFYIREIEPETSHIDSMALIAIVNGEEKRLNYLNFIPMITKHGDIVPIEFEPLPDGTTELYVEATGYYIWEG